MKVYASNATQVVKCPGSLALCDKHRGEIPQDFSHAEEGTQIHKVVEELIKTGTTTSKNRDHIYYARRVLSEIPTGANSETKYQSAELGSNVIIDAWILSDKCLYVYDFKFGFSPVKAVDNFQLVAYACAIAQNLSVAFERCELTILQPRSFDGETKRVWKLSYEELRQQQLKLNRSVDLALAANAPTIVGDQCKYCVARHVCETNTLKVAQAIDLAHNTEDYTGLLGEQLVALQEAQELIKSKISALEAIILAKIKKGEVVQGWTITQGVGHRRWRDENQAKLFAALEGVDLTKTTVCTPAEAERRGFSQVEELSEKGKTADKLKQEIDPREVFK